MNLQERINLLTQSAYFLQKDHPAWLHAVQSAGLANPWFTPEFCQIAAANIVEHFLSKNALIEWTNHYCIDDSITPTEIGIVMAGNIPMVGFHDFLATFICGHKQKIKLSSKDEVLMKYFIQVLSSLNTGINSYVSIEEKLTDCKAYIATGSNNTSRYFDYYFGKYPSIIRRNKTSVAVLSGKETNEDLAALADDIHLYFGLGCRNVTHLYVPLNYDFVPLLAAFNKYRHFKDHHKYKNNFDFQLSLLLMNNCYYMTNGSTLLVENPNHFTPVSVVHYSFYNQHAEVELKEQLQCIIGNNFTPFGHAQKPSLFNYADGIDTMEFLVSIG